MTPTDFIFLFMIRVDPSPVLFYFYFFIRSELIQPGLAVRVDPVRLLCLPAKIFVCPMPKISHVMIKFQASHLGRFHDLWNNGRRRAAVDALWHYGRLAIHNSVDLLCGTTDAELHNSPLNLLCGTTDAELNNAV